MSQLSVSVIIPVFNGERTLGRCLENLLIQNYPHDLYEIIVVENGSTYATSSIAERYPIHLLHSKERGPAAARNLGIANSQAEIIAFTDADCVTDPNWLLELIRPYTEATVGGVAGKILAYVHEERNFIETFSDEFAPLRNYVSGKDEFLPHLYTANASYRRSVLEKLGGFNPAMFTGEDVDLSWRAQLFTKSEVRYAPDAIIYHHHRSTWKSLGRQYRQYGFGEIMLDTLYKSQPGYPRKLSFQIKRMLQQILALPHYSLSMVLRYYRLKLKRITAYEAIIPRIFLMIEANNILGKIEALIVTRLMTNAHPFSPKKIDGYIGRYY